MASAVQPSPLAGEHDDWLSRLGEELNAREWSPNLLAIVEKLGGNEPLNLNDGMLLYNHQDLPELGALANAVRIACFGPSTKRTELARQDADIGLIDVNV